MSVLIEDMKKPKFCYEIIDGKYEQCQFVNANNDCILLLNKGVCETWWADQYSKCPLIETLEPCEDAVSRKSIRDKISEKDNWEKYDRYNLGLHDAMRVVRDEPSVALKRKTGKWIEYDSDEDKYDVIKCPCCKHTFTVDAHHWTDIGFVKDDLKFCPNCGADMNPLPEPYKPKEKNNACD